MTHTVIKEQVDIHQLPEICSVANSNTQITVGDLHGNAIKLLFMLVKQGITTNITKANYEKLVEIYRKQVDELTKEELEEFSEMLAGVKFNNKTTIRLIGDELADRGSNDYFTLKTLQKLHEQQVPVEIILSNHNTEFLEACEKHKETNNFHAPMLGMEHAVSLERLNTLVEKGLVSAEEVLDIVQNAYKPSLKAISYSLNKDNSEITIYSHAAIGLNIIKGLAEQFAVLYQDSTTIELARTIDKINRKFQEHVLLNTLHSQCPPEAMIEGYGGYADLTKTSLVCAIWNRRYDLIERPANQNGYNLVYVHGHDSNDPEQRETHVHNLDEDNNLGKLANFNKGAYLVLSTSKL